MAYWKYTIVFGKQQQWCEISSMTCTKTMFCEYTCSKFTFCNIFYKIGSFSGTTTTEPWVTVMNLWLFDTTHYLFQACLIAIVSMIWSENTSTSPMQMSIHSDAQLYQTICALACWWKILKHSWKWTRLYNFMVNIPWIHSCRLKQKSVLHG